MAFQPLGLTTPFKKSLLSQHVAKTAAAVALMAAASPSAFALSFDLDNGVTVDLDTTVGYNVAWRRADRDPNVLQFPSSNLGFLTDDGNRNFDKGDMIQNQVNFSTDLDVNYGKGGVFARARGWYDEVYDDDDLIGTDANGNPKSFQKSGLDDHKSQVELQDLFWYHGFELGDKSLSLRVGNQVVNWGESLFIQGGISTAQGPLDATKANTPGVALKDIFMPIGQVYGELTLTDTLSLGAYYQYDWEETRIDAPGSYFNVLDGLGQGSVGDTMDTEGLTTLLAAGGLLPPAAAGTRLPVTENKPDKGQYGVAVRYLAEELNSTEFGFYYINYNDFTPALEFLTIPEAGVPSTTSFNLNQNYYEDIDLYGLSFGTVFGDMNVSGEISYRDGIPVLHKNPTGGFAYVKGEIIQAQTSGIYIFPQNPLADTLTFVGEIAANRIVDIDHPNGLDALAKDRTAASTVLSLSADYLNIVGGLDMKLTGTYRNDFNGRSSMEFSFAEGTEQFALKTDFTYLGKHKFGASYVWYLTDTDDIIADRGGLAFGHLNADRDYLAAYYKYSF